MDKLNELMEHIDYFFHPISHLYKSDVEFEVYLKDKIWTITHSDTSAQIGTTDHTKVINYLNEFNADLTQLHTLVLKSVINEGVLRRMQLKRVEELVGEKAIDEQEKAWDDFGSQLTNMIDKTLNKPNLTVVE